MALYDPFKCFSNTCFSTLWDTFHACAAVACVLCSELRTAETYKQECNSPLSADSESLCHYFDQWWKNWIMISSNVSCLTDNAVHSRAGQMCYSRSTRAAGCRSPVHLLLTSDLPAERNYWPPSNANQICKLHVKHD